MRIVKNALAGTLGAAALLLDLYPADLNKQYAAEKPTASYEQTDSRSYFDVRNYLPSLGPKDAEAGGFVAGSFSYARGHPVRVIQIPRRHATVITGFVGPPAFFGVVPGYVAGFPGAGFCGPVFCDDPQQTIVIREVQQPVYQLPAVAAPAYAAPAPPAPVQPAYPTERLVELAKEAGRGEVYKQELDRERREKQVAPPAPSQPPAALQEYQRMIEDQKKVIEDQAKKLDALAKQIGEMKQPSWLERALGVVSPKPAEAVPAPERDTYKLGYIGDVCFSQVPGEVQSAYNFIFQRVAKVEKREFHAYTDIRKGKVTTVVKDVNNIEHFADDYSDLKEKTVTGPVLEERLRRRLKALDIDANRYVTFDYVRYSAKCK